MAGRKGEVVTDMLGNEMIANSGAPAVDGPSLDELTVQLMERARVEGVQLVGPGGLLSG